jgi:hypothetical protein
MGKTYHKNSKKFEDDFSGQRSGKTTGKKSGGMKTLNSYVDEEYDDPFVDEIDGITDEIFIQHIKQNDTN